MRNAMLAPVPQIHLESAEGLRDGDVLFGSRLWELFEGDEVTQGLPLFIVATHPPEKRVPGEAVVEWEAVFERYWRAEHLPRELKRLRPPSTSWDREEDWPGFYQVSSLRRLSEEEQVGVSTFKKRDGDSISRAFVPHGPLLVQA